MSGACLTLARFATHGTWHLSCGFFSDAPDISGPGVDARSLQRGPAMLGQAISLRTRNAQVL